jgi:hypothetical protein
MVALAAVAAPAVWGQAPKIPPAKLVPALSVFVMPITTSQGRDPFYPESNRPYEENKPHSVVEESAIAVKGVSVEHGRVLVIINNHTFAVGDEGDVLTTTGRAHLRLAEIRSKSVIIEINGRRRELSTVLK